MFAGCLLGVILMIMSCCRGYDWHWDTHYIIKTEIKDKRIWLQTYSMVPSSDGVSFLC